MRIIKRILPFSSLAIISVSLVFVFTNLIFPNLSQVVNSKVKAAYTAQNVPELNEILNGNQDVRLKATRKLVERVDVNDAMEILEHSTLPKTGEGHLAVHQIGFFAYRKYGFESILKCKDYFLYACYHGSIIEASSDQGFEAISGMADYCRDYQSRYFQCAHAAGHAINAIWNYDLPNALKTCDEVFENKQRYEGALESCHNGAFMENLYGVHDYGTEEEIIRDWLSDDMFFPCNAFGEKYQKGCWLNQAARIYQMFGGDIYKTARSCEQIGTHQYTVWCIDSLSRQIHALTDGQIDRVFGMCQILGNYWREDCIITNSGSYFSVGDPETGIKICNKIIAPAKGECYGQSTGQLKSALLSTLEKSQFCKIMEEGFENNCLKEI